MTDQLRAVLVGCGGMSNTWMTSARDLGSVAMAGFVDLSAGAAEKRQAEYGAPGSVVGTDLATVLDQTNPDIVFDCTIPEAHYGTTMAALRHGCHVLGEKPLADSMERAREMVGEAERAGRIYAVIQNRRYNPNIRRYSALVQSGAIGDVTTVNSDFYLAPHFGGFRDGMKHVLLLDMAIHSFDQARLICGADPVRVFCKEWNPAGSWYVHGASAVCIFTMSNGAVYTYRGSWCAEGLPTPWECAWRAIGTRGTAIWDGAETITVEVALPGDGFTRSHERVPLPPATNDAKSDGHRGIIREFIDCVRTGRTPETAASDNVKSLSMVFGAIESAESGREVEIPSSPARRPGRF